MAVSFLECMRGELTDLWGRPHSVDFHLRAVATHTGRFIGDGKLALTGTIHAPPWANEQAVEGELELSPFWRRTLRYELRFLDHQSRPLRLRGVKNVSFLRPTHSMTHMAASLECEQQVVAQGELRFDLNELVAFAAGWSIAPPVERLDMGATGLTPTLNAAQRTILAAIAHALIVAGERVPAMDEASLAMAERAIQILPGPARTAYRLALRAFDASTLVSHRRRFSQLSEASQKDYLEEISGHGPKGDVAPTLRRILALLSSPIKTTHFSRPDYQQAIGISHPTGPMVDEQPRWRERVLAAEDLKADTELEAEVVIVGTGAGGGALAAELAERGVAVLLVEEGRYRTRRDFQGPPSERMGKLWKHHGMTFGIGNPPISIPLGKLVGGTTAINSGTCFRTPDSVLQSWQSDFGFPADFSPSNFASYLQCVEQELQVGPNARRFLGAIADVVATGADAMGLAHGPLPRNAPGCDGQGVCIFGCPTDAKRSTNNSYIPRALKAGAQLVTGLPVTRLLMRNRRAIGVEATGSTTHGAPRRLRIKAQLVVVACGAIYSPVLLMANGFRLPALGRNLSIHPGFGAWVLCEQPMKPWSGVPQGYGVEGFDEQGIRFEGYYTPPELGSLIVSATGKELTRWMDNHARVGSFGFMVRDDNKGRVLRDFDGRALIRYDLSKESVHKLKLGTSLLAELLLRGGGSEVQAAIDGLRPIRSIKAAQQLRHASINAADFRLIGCHPLATCRMGASPENAVVDYEHRVFGTDNLYVVDGSNVPTALGVNPQMTIMAFATRAAQILAAQL